MQPRNICPCLTERLLMGRKETNQTKSFPDYFYPFSEFDMDDSTEDDEFYSDYLGNRKAKKCNHSNMKCTTQTNDQWRTPPYWRGNIFIPQRSRRDIVLASSVRPSVHSVRPSVRPPFLSVWNHISVPIGQI